MKFDKNTICNNIKKARPQELMLITTLLADKNTKKHALIEIEKILNKGSYDIITIKK
jgi:hypothetical protein